MTSTLAIGDQILISSFPDTSCMVRQGPKGSMRAEGPKAGVGFLGGSQPLPTS